MSYSYDTLFLLFMLYSIMGWLLEVTCKLIEKHKFINRGFLIGPYCPIYGHGAILMILLLIKYQSDPLLLFTMSIVICSILEYFTSYFMKGEAVWCLHLTPERMGSKIQRDLYFWKC